MSAHDMYAEMIRDTSHECLLLRSDIEALRSLLSAALLLIPPGKFEGFKTNSTKLLLETAKPMRQRFNEAVASEVQARGAMQ